MLTDIHLVAKSPEELEIMLTDIHLASKPEGLSLILRKTKVMLNENAITSTVSVDRHIIERAERYVYLCKSARLSFLGSRCALHWDGQHSARWPTS